MLHRLNLENVGPAPRFDLELGTRLNLLTGDNGLGKSFLLDIVWWALTRRWPQEVNRRLTSGYPARPRDPKKPARIAFELSGKAGGRVTYQSEYKSRDEAWIGKAGRPWSPGLVLYAHADGGFSVWDPARNYWKTKGNADVQDRQPAYVFTAAEVWTGLPADDKRTLMLCDGLLADWSLWILGRDPNAEAMAAALRALSPEPDGPQALRPGLPTRLSTQYTQNVPTLHTGHTEAVPILHASAGVRRVTALAYMLTWAWSEHRRAAELLGEAPTRRVVLLVDEVESHLHPRWQRLIIGALRALMKVQHTDSTLQLFAATHSPLVLASVEPWFDPAEDAWFDLDLETGAQAAPPEVVLRRRVFIPHGTAGNWLTSEAFDLATDRGSVEAEQAILAARALMLDPASALEAVMAAHAALRAVLPDTDRFWVRWCAFVERRGGQP